MLRARDLFLSLGIWSLVSCGPQGISSYEFKFDAAHSVALDGTIEAGSVETSSDDDDVARAQILEQLRYAVGQLNGVDAGIDLTRAAVEVNEKTPLQDGRFRVSYTAKALISWPREARVPQSYQLLLPARGDGASLATFVQSFGSDAATNKRCLGDDAHEISTGSFWYYYRPNKVSCPLASGSDPATVRLPLKLAPSAVNSEGKSPEYGKVWEDGKLVIAAVYSKYESGATDPADVGIEAYRAGYDALIAYFGAPTADSLPQGERPSAEQPEISLSFRSWRGPVEVTLILVDSVAGASPSFRQKYEALTETADFVSYDGHSGLGDNIRALTSMGRYMPGQYQVFLLNGCDSLSYVDDRLRLAHQAVNPQHGPDKFVDVITNARPSLFFEMTRATMAVVRGLVEQASTYRQILAEFDGSQRAAVTGEEDNLWPEPFGE